MRAVVPKEEMMKTLPPSPVILRSDSSKRARIPVERRIAIDMMSILRGSGSLLLKYPLRDATIPDEPYSGYINASPGASWKRCPTPCRGTGSTAFPPLARGGRA